jgi:leucyl aminopeptidase
MYRAPILENLEVGSKVTANERHQLILQLKKAPLSKELEKALPAHVREHSALKGDKGSKLVIHGLPSKVLYGIGALKDFTPQDAAEHGEAIGHALNGEQLAEVHVTFPADLKDKDIIINFLKGVLLANWKFDELKTKQDNGKKVELRKVSFSGGASGEVSKADIANLSSIVTGIAFARELVELPGGTATPEEFCARVSKAIDPKLVSLEIWDEKRIRKEGMGLLTAVSQGSHMPPRFLIARTGKDMAGKKPSLFIVGKGVTFDTGGINLKTGMGFRDLKSMKGDMAGAAAVVGAALALSQTKPGLPVVAVAPLTMNAIGSRAIIPGDVVKSYAGKTVEIENTDAEGRLILADALHFAVQEKAHWIVNVATLTGACVVALGKHFTGLFSNHNDFTEEVLLAAEASGEPAWPMPTTSRYKDELKSSVADLSNMGKGREGGASLGACFLEHFVGTTPWVHLDIAGSSDLGGPAAGVNSTHAAGRMVHTLVTLAHRLGEQQRGNKK